MDIEDCKVNSCSPIEELLGRVCGVHAQKFKYEWIDAEGKRDVWQLKYSAPHVILCGNTPVSMAVALHNYLKDELNIHFSWCGNRVSFPDILPPPKDINRHVILQEERVNLNYCTFNYTAAWWDWERWEKEIDFMALNGINRPLAMIGQEGIWYELLLKFGFTDKEARGFLTGPAYFAWQWMTNIQSFGGPVSLAYIRKRIRLGQKIIKRYLELGMIPVQQGFSGFLPIEAIDKFPKAKIIRKPGWCNFPDTAQLDPLDPLFHTMGLEFMKCQQRLFGSFHYYAADPFHEGEPPSDAPDYLHLVGEQIGRVFRTFDPQYIWVMQAWSIRKEITLASPREHVLVLDINGDTYSKLDNFWGYPFVLGELHNFGGRTNLHGDIRRCAEFSYREMQSTLPNLRGRGVFMESMVQNPAYYDVLFSMLTKPYPMNLEKWKESYSLRRYGVYSLKINEAWNILLNTVYARGTNDIEKSSIICARPAVHVKKSGPNSGFDTNYTNQELLRAAELLWDEKERAKDAEGYRYDMVDICRQLLSNYAQSVYQQAIRAWDSKDRKSFSQSKNEFLVLLQELDALLSTREEFRFAKWLTDARKSACTQEESDLFEKNASMLLTLWGPEEGTEIFDYAWREWSGLIEQYYKMRWEMFFDMLEKCLAEGAEYSEENLPMVYGRESFEANDFYKKMAEKEREWVNEPNKGGFSARMDELSEVSAILGKYGPIIQKDTVGMIKSTDFYLKGNGFIN
ncbi:alpha-N-acetylglucosaminidase [Blautia hominis]|uniref:Alpha-N-acetylglucosaminidase n=1 Tax=Blautia hominis TaxID=2025493 RepID=A0ABQ0B557_9FIRM